MTTELERRHFIQSAGLLAGAAAATSLASPAWAQGAQPTGA
jgi:phosphodiesterase/alkaline phosphatase D-like protein